jgi:hypothetical protein
LHGPPEEAGRLRVVGGFNIKGSLLVVETCMVGFPPSDGHMSRFNMSLAVARAGSFSNPRMSQSRTAKSSSLESKAVFAFESAPSATTGKVVHIMMVTSIS